MFTFLIDKNNREVVAFILKIHNRISLRGKIWKIIYN